MSGFSIEWLDLREEADRCARDSQLLEQARRWLETDMKHAAGMNVVDLGAGTGSTLRAFAATDSPDRDSLSWRLVDKDTDLLAEASRRHGETHSLKTYQMDLASIAELPLAGAQLITASALFDLVSADFVDALAAAVHDRCQQQSLGLYAALNYDGTTRWTPEHPLDEAVLSAFNRDQQRDKGFGVALGPDAGRYMERKFKTLGFKVLRAESPWKLNGTDSELVQALITGIGEAVKADTALDAGQLQDWIRFRSAHAVSGTCEVGHTDLLILPKAI